MSTLVSEDGLAGLVAERVVDTRGNCAGGLLDARKVIAQIGIGNVLELWSSDSHCKEGVRAWATKAGHEFLCCIAGPGYDRIFVRRLR